MGILARVPLASGMLTGKFTRESRFDSDDHRAFNRHGESFDRGETFSGLDFDVALEAVEELRRICPPGMSLSQFALRWILMFDAVTCAIPGAKRKGQIAENISVLDIPTLTDETMKAVRAIYGLHVRKHVHDVW